jgi:HK97 family phage prohead protease
MEIIKKSKAGRVADTYDFVLSDGSVDRHGDIVVQDGLDLAPFKKNPVALFQHDHSAPVGVWSNLRRVGDQLLGTFSPVAQGTSRVADIARSLLAQGVLRAVSISFIGKEKVFLEPRGVKFVTSELLEVSLVTVGANPNALMIAKSLNMTDEEIQKYLPSAVPVGINGGAHSDALQLARREAIQKRAVDTLYHAKTTLRKLR